MSIGAYYEAAKAKRQSFGWKDNNKTFVLGERELTIAETRYSPPHARIVPYIPLMKQGGSVEEWLESINNPIAILAVTLALTAPLMRFINSRSYLINFYGNREWMPLLKIINSIYGDMRGLTTIRLTNFVEVFDNFPVTYPDIDRTDKRIVKDILRINNKRIFSVSTNPLNIDHERIINIPLPPFTEEIVLPKSHGVFVDGFIKKAIAHFKFKQLSSSGNIHDDVEQMLEVVKQISGIDGTQFYATYKGQQDIRETYLYEYLHSNSKNTLVTVGKAIKPANRLYVPDGPILMRYDVDKNMFYVNYIEFKKACKIKKEDIDENLSLECIVDIKPKAMFGGSFIKASQLVTAIHIDATKVLDFNKEKFLNDLGIRSRS